MAWLPGKKHELLGPRDGTSEAIEQENLLIKNTKIEWGSFEEFAKTMQGIIGRQKYPSVQDRVEDAIRSISESLSKADRYGEYNHSIAKVLAESTHSILITGLITQYVATKNRNFPARVYEENTATVLQFMVSAWAQEYRDNHS